MLFNSLEKARTIWLLFAVSIAMMVIFEIVKTHWNLTLIDGLSSPVDARAQLMQLTAEQRLVHAIVTATVDVIYPIALGGFFAGITLRSFERFGGYLAILPLAAIPVDLTEGVIQVLALTDTYDALQLKAFVTPTKFALFMCGFFLSLLAGRKWVAANIRRLVKR